MVDTKMRRQSVFSCTQHGSVDTVYRNAWGENAKPFDLFHLFTFTTGGFANNRSALCS